MALLLCNTSNGRYRVGIVSEKGSSVAAAMWHQEAVHRPADVFLYTSNTLQYFMPKRTICSPTSENVAVLAHYWPLHTAIRPLETHTRAYAVRPMPLTHPPQRYQIKPACHLVAEAADEVMPRPGIRW